MIMKQNNWYVLHTKVDSKNDKSVRYYGHKMDKLWRDDTTHSVTIKFGGDSID